MSWLTLSVLLAAIGGAHFQCLTGYDKNWGEINNLDLSGITDFGFELFKELSQSSDHRNLFFSPYSIWNALTLAYFGSRGNTQMQLESTLRIPSKMDALSVRRALDQKYKKRFLRNAPFAFKLSSRAYLSNYLKVRPCLINVLPEEIQEVDFDNIIDSAKSINNFVSETTDGAITDIVDPTDIRNALMVLVNAIYFKGTWKHPFNKYKTHVRPFHMTPRTSASLPIMSIEENFRYGESKTLGAKVLEVPYSGDTISMFLFLPMGENPPLSKFVDMVNKLNASTFRQAIGPNNMRLLRYHLLLPKFKFTQTIQNELQSALKNIGITDLFDSKADLNSFVNGTALNVKKTVHKAFIEVDEEGTEAAASTSMIKATSAPLEFNCNRPFIFIIYDHEYSNTLFMGIIKNPGELQE